MRVESSRVATVTKFLIRPTKQGADIAAQSASSKHYSRFRGHSLHWFHIPAKDDAFNDDKGLGKFCKNMRAARCGKGILEGFSLKLESRHWALIGARGTHRGTESIQSEAWTLWVLRKHEICSSRERSNDHH